MHMQSEWLRVVSDPFLNFWSRVVATLPGIVGALLLLLIGFMLARGLRAVAEKLFRSIRLDEYTEKVGFNEILSRVGFGRSPGFVVGFLVYWLIVLVFIVSAANVVELTVVSELLENFVLFIPKLIASILILFGGLVLGHFVAQIVANAATSNNIRGGSALSQLANVVVIIFASLMALEQLGINTEILSSSFQIILGAICLALALAFGLGGRDMAADIIKDFFKSKRN
ncbi:MAG: hypothetical protein HY747_03275 [Elusimicrobia bacterium]|nr:hypothetical protein [Elusimicrobiota bacterium]